MKARAGERQDLMVDTPDLPDQVAELESRARRIETRYRDGRMVWRCWGEGAPVVMLHGGSGSWTHWLRNIMSVVRSGRTAWVPDLPGFGDSDPMGDDADQIVAPLLHGLEELDGRSHQIVAFSFGALVAVLLAADYPARVSSLLLVGAPVVPLPHRAGIAWRSWRDLGDTSEREIAHRENLRALMLDRPESVDVTAVRIQRLNAERDRMGGRKLVTTDAFARALARVECDFAAVYGARDVLFRQQWSRVNEALSRNPHFRSMHLVDNAGHWVQFEMPEQFDHLLIEWLSGRELRP
jgi:2-hydroxy-6-oxonona-2,4-dienedioate hydrolase